MIRIIAIPLILGLAACAGATRDSSPPDPTADLFKNRRVITGLDTLFTNRGLVGSILLYDEGRDSLYSNDFDWNKDGALPASTFKILNTAIGLEMGFLADRTTKFRWDSVVREMATWNEDMTVAQAFTRSCVPCYQELARRIGPDSMNHYLRALDYADIEVDPEHIDDFWLLGSARINQLQQIRFLYKLKHRLLPLRTHTYNELAAIMRRGDGSDFELSGKTGWSVDGGHNNGWFVGYAVKGERTIYVAVNIEPAGALDREVFTAARVDIAVAGLQTAFAMDGRATR